MSNALAVIDETITNTKMAITDTIKQYQWSLIPDTQLHAAKVALTKNQFAMKIAAGNPEAVKDALIQASTLGIDLTEGKRQGWLLPRKNANGQMIIQLQVGYKGVEAIHQRMGVIDRLSITIVRENDEFEWSGDDQEKPKHKADWFAAEDKRGKISGAFAITYFPDKSIHVTVKPISEVYEKHRDISDSWKSYQARVNKGENAFPPPWVSFEGAMVEKTMAYVASKQWPANIRDEGQASKILETLHSVDTSDHQESFARYTLEQKQIYMDAVESNDALGFYILNKKITLEAAMDLDSSYMRGVPRGKKGVPGRQAARECLAELQRVGEEIFISAIEAIDNDDKAAFEELIDGAGNFAKRALSSSLNDIQKATINTWFDS